MHLRAPSESCHSPISALASLRSLSESSITRLVWRTSPQYSFSPCSTRLGRRCTSLRSTVLTTQRAVHARSDLSHADLGRASLASKHEQGFEDFLQPQSATASALAKDNYARLCGDRHVPSPLIDTLPCSAAQHASPRVAPDRCSPLYADHGSPQSPQAVLRACERERAHCNGPKQILVMLSHEVKHLLDAAASPAISCSC